MYVCPKKSKIHPIDRCYDFKNIFAKKLLKIVIKIGFLFIYCWLLQKLDRNNVFFKKKEKCHFSAENC
jgi:hypothetical protein